MDRKREGKNSVDLFLKCFQELQQRCIKKEVWERRLYSQCGFAWATSLVTLEVMTLSRHKSIVNP